MTEPATVIHDSVRHTFAIKTTGAPAFLRYSLHDGAIDLLHTEVPAEYAGHGYGGALAKAALDYARAGKLRVIPTCPFVRAYIQRHPENASLLGPPE